MTEEPVDRSLVMPFVVCQSKGGPYDDSSFTAGFAAGMLWIQLGLGELGLGRLPEPQAMRNDLLPQVDLIAMHHGWTTRVEPYDDEWAMVEFVPVGSAP